MQKIIKSILLFLLAFSFGTTQAQLNQIDLPVTFDLTNVDYTVTDFGGNSTVLGPDPTNAANTVAITTKGATAQTWAGTTVGTNLGFANPIPFTANNRKMRVRVYSPDANIPVRLKVEVHGQAGQSVETEAMTTTANAWEWLNFNFNNEAPGTAAFNAAYAYDMASIFFNFGTDGATAGAKTYYFENVKLMQAPPAQIDLPVTFDLANVNYTVTDFGGNSTVLGPDPNNAANTVAITTKDVTAQTWAGTTIGTNLGFASVIPFTAVDRKMQVRVYSPDANIPVRLKVEVHGQPGKSVETEALTTGVNTWEWLTFDFDNEAPGTAAFNAAFPYDMASIFFNFGTDGATAGQKTYLFDDVEFVAGALNQIDLPVTFDLANVDYTVTDFGGNSTVLGPDPNNAANTVAITTKDVTAQTWAGTTIGTNLGFASVIPFTAVDRKMQVRVYSPDANIPVRLKVEVHGQPGQSVETEALTTGVNTWEWLTFDFDNEAPGTAAFNAAFPYDMASIFFNFGTDGATAGQKTYLFDDVEFVSGALNQIDLPVTFDLTNVDYTVTDFGGNSTVLGPDPNNAANTVAITTKDVTAQTWAGTTIGTNLGFASVIPFTAVDRKMRVRVYSPDANIPVRLKVEVHGQPGQSVETEALTTGVNTWEWLTFDFDNEAPGTAAFNAAFPYDMASIFFNFGTDGATAGQKTYLFDDVEFVSGANLGLVLPITYDDSTITYTMTDFDGGITTLMTNPYPGGLDTTPKVLRMIKNVGQVWGGSKLTLASALDFTTNNTFKMFVYSPRTGCPVLFKLENSAGGFVEKSDTTSVANAWEELSWDFSGTASNTYTDLVFIYDLGVMGDSSSNFTFYQDEIRFVAGGGTGLNQINLPVYFDSLNVDYTLTDFGGNASALGADPNNAANKVAITTKTAAAQTWAGTTIGTNLGFANIIPFTANNHKMRVRVYSPDANIPVRLKVEVHGQPTQSVETEALTTGVNTWEYLVFDFDNEAPGTAVFNPAYLYDMASIFFNFGTDGATAGQKTYYWDDVELFSSIGLSETSQSSFMLYPNPTTITMHVYVSDNSKLQNAKFEVLDLTGRVILNGQLNNGLINTSNLGKGIFTLKIITPQGVMNNTFVKQ